MNFHSETVLVWKLKVKTDLVHQRGLFLHFSSRCPLRWQVTNCFWTFRHWFKIVYIEELGAKAFWEHNSRTSLGISNQLQVAWPGCVQRQLHWSNRVVPYPHFNGQLPVTWKATIRAFYTCQFNYLRTVAAQTVHLQNGRCLPLYRWATQGMFLPDGKTLCWGSFCCPLFFPLLWYAFNSKLTIQFA